MRGGQCVQLPDVRQQVRPCAAHGQCALRRAAGPPYEYMDQVDDVQAHIQEIKADLAAGNTAPYREFLNTAIEEAREETAVEVAKVLKSQLDKLDSPKRESVMEKLAQAAEKAAPASPSPKRKEPER